MSIPNQRHDLFSVLGTVAEFPQRHVVLNRDDFAAWLKKNEAALQSRVASWIPDVLSEGDRASLLAEIAKVVEIPVRRSPGR